MDAERLAVLDDERQRAGLPAEQFDRAWLAAHLADERRKASLRGETGFSSKPVTRHPSSTSTTPKCDASFRGYSTVAIVTSAFVHVLFQHVTIIHLIDVIA